MIISNLFKNLVSKGLGVLQMLKIYHTFAEQ